MKRAQLFFWILLILSIACCQKIEPVKGQKPVLLVSVSPYRFLVEKIAGADFEVQSVVPVASNPHSFEPTAAQVAQAAMGEVWFQVGEPFERKVQTVFRQKGVRITIQDLKEGLPLIGQCCHGEPDRHLWMSPKLAAAQSALITKTLKERYPEKAPLFQENFEQLKQELTLLDVQVEKILKPVKGRAILVSHPAFGYFCRDYGLRQISVEQEGKDPRPKHVEEILNNALSESYEVALALPQHNNKGAQMIAEKLKMKVRYVDPYAANYPEMMKRLAEVIAGIDAD